MQPLSNTTESVYRHAATEQHHRVSSHHQCPRQSTRGRGADESASTASLGRGTKGRPGVNGPANHRRVNRDPAIVRFVGPTSSSTRKKQRNVKPWAFCFLFLSGWLVGWLVWLAGWFLCLFVAVVFVCLFLFLLSFFVGCCCCFGLLFFVLFFVVVCFVLFRFVFVVCLFLLLVLLAFVVVVGFCCCCFWVLFFVFCSNRGHGHT